MDRIAVPELLDALPPTHKLAIGSRADIRRLNRLMGNARFLAWALQENLPGSRLALQPLRMVDLGAGEGWVMLDVARRASAIPNGVQLTLLDRHSVVAEAAWRGLAELGWQANLALDDVHTWLEKPAPSVDVMFANLLLHQFAEKDLRRLLELIMARTRLFIACEPRRTSFAETAARCVRFIGCNTVTRHDAPASVRAGFVANELSALWPAGDAWQLNERAAGWFSHLFIAKRNG